MFWPDIVRLTRKKTKYSLCYITQCYIGYPILYVRVHRGVRLTEANSSCACKCATLLLCIIVIGENMNSKHIESLEEIFRRVQFVTVDMESTHLDDEVLSHI